ncbi:hook complex protein, conserved [Trypanosoma cruzi]|uniref:Hook complex protein, conserved n=1 Tax=Trypanosoma cruzi TaxID=5693 RepID=A0A2V2WL44_TRYCR|nr:hook complex protein, conserved [Trypanosoma cruzi]
MFLRSRSSSPASRVRSSSLRSVSPTSERWDKTISTYSIAGTARSVEYGGNLRVWTAEMDGRIVIRAAARGEILFEASARESAFCTVLRKVSARQIWAAFSDGFIRCYNSTNGNMEHEFVQHDGAVRSLASSPVSDYVYSGGDDWKVYQWSKSRCTYIRLFSGHSNGVQCVLVVPSTTNAGAVYATEDILEENDEDGTIENSLPSVVDGELKDEFVLSGGDDMTIKVWDPMAPLQIETDEACLATLRGHSGSVRAIEIHPRSGYLWSGGDDCTIRVWNWCSEETRRCVATLRGQHSGPITSIVYIAPRMWSSGKDGFVVVWNTRQLAPLQRLRLAPRSVNCPFLSMRRLYRAMHWAVWLGGPESTIHVLHVSEEEHGAGAVLRRRERRRTLEKRKFPKSREYHLARKPHLIRLRERRKEIEEQLRKYRACPQEENILIPERGAARVRGGTPSGGSEEDARIAEIEVLRATVAELENQVKAHEETIMRTSYIAKEKDGVIRSLTRQLSEKDSELRRMEEELNRRMTRHASSQEVGRTRPTEKERELQEGRDENTEGNVVFDPYKDVEQLQAQQKLEVEDMRRQLLDMQKYKELWEEKDNELRQANEKIEKLQASLDTERNFNSLTRELSRYSKEHTTPVPCRKQSKVHSLPYTPTTHHYYKRIFGTCWPDLEKEYQKDLKETLWAEYIDLISNSDAIVREITYTTANDCLIVDATIESKEKEGQEIQNLIESHTFSRTLALHGILASSFLVSTPGNGNISDEQYEAVAAAKAKAEAERDDARQKLRGAEEGLESFRRQAESRRAQIAGLQSAASSARPTASSTRNAAPPLYTVTAEEYEAVAAAKAKAEAERDDARQKLRGAEEGLESFRRQAESRRAQIAGLQSAASSTRPTPSSTRNAAPPLYTVTAEEYEAVAAAKAKAEAERDDARQKLRGAEEGLESFRRQAESRRAQIAGLQSAASSAKPTPSSTRNAAPPLYTVTAEEYEAVAAAKAKAEAERDDARQKLRGAEEGLESFRRQAESRRAQIAGLQSAASSAKPTPSSTRNAAPPLYTVTAEEYEAVAAAKAKAEAERDDARQKLRGAEEGLESFRRQAESRRAQIAGLQSAASSTRPTPSSTRNAAPPLYTVTAEEYEAVAAAKAKAEAERDDARQKLRGAEEGLESFRRQAESRRAQIAGLQSAASSAKPTPSSTRNAAAPLYTVTAEEYEAVAAAKAKAEAERDDARQKLRGAEEGLESFRRQAESRRAQIAGLQSAASSTRPTPSSTRNAAPPLYTVTAEEYEAVAAAKAKAEAERDDARQKLRGAEEGLDSFRRQAESRRAQIAGLQSAASSTRPTPSSTRNAAPPLYTVTAEEYEAVAAAKAKAEAERDDARQKLRGAEEGLESFRRQAESRRAQIAGLQSAASSTRPTPSSTRNAAPPLYTVTAEEYEAVAAAKAKAEAERDDARQKLRGAEEGLESFRRQAESRRAQIAGLQSAASSTRPTPSSTRNAAPPLYTVTAEEYEAVAAAKAKAEAERDDARQKLRGAEEGLESFRRQAESRRAQIAGLQSAASSTRPTPSSTRNAAPPLYTVTAEEYEAVAAAKAKAEAERDDARQKLRGAEEGLESFRRQAESRRAQIAGLQSAASSAKPTPSSTRNAAPPLYTVTAEEYEAVAAAKAKAEAERDDARQKLRGAEEGLESFRRQAESRRAQIAGLQSAASSTRPTPSSTRNAAPPLYTVTAEEYEAVAAAKAKAEAERDDARQKLRGAEEGLESFRRQAESRRAQIAGLQSAASSTRPTPSSTRNAAPPLYTVTAEEYEAVAFSRIGARESYCRPESSNWVRYHYNLGEACVYLVRHYRQLVEDVLLLEFSRATRLPIDYSRRVEFVSGGLAAEFYACPSKDTVDVDFLLRRHSFSRLASLMQLSGSVKNQSLCTCSSEATVANVSPVMANEMAQPNIRMASLGSQKLISGPWSLQDSNHASILKELELFRSRRALAGSMRRSETTLNVSFDLPNRINPSASVDSSELQREPVYCVTLDEYHALLQQLTNAYRTLTDDDDENENGTRLWNEHVVARAEEERRFTRQMSRLEPWYADSGGSSKKKH